MWSLLTDLERWAGEWKGQLLVRGNGSYIKKEAKKSEHQPLGSHGNHSQNLD